MSVCYPRGGSSGSSLTFWERFSGSWHLGEPPLGLIPRIRDLPRIQESENLNSRGGSPRIYKKIVHMTREEFIDVLERSGIYYDKYNPEGLIVIEDTLGNGGEYDPEGIHVRLGHLTSLPSGVVFDNSGDVYLNHLETIPPGVEFRNDGVCYMMLGWLHEWQGNVPGVSDKSLLNLMIRKGMFL